MAFRSLLTLFFLFSTIFPTTAASKPSSPRARALAPLLKPLGFTPKADPNGLAQLTSQVTKILTALEASASSNGPQPRGLLESAFTFEDFHGPTHESVVASSLVRMWENARGLGLFNSEGSFSTVITRGNDKGAKAVFEYVVPVSKAPEFSRSIANLRLVSPSAARTQPESVTPQELAYANQLQAILRESTNVAAQKKFDQGPNTNAMGRTKEEEYAIWQKEMTAAGETALQTPSITIKGKMQQGPAKDNNYRYGVLVEIYNVSRFPTEVKLAYSIVGSTDIKRIPFLMKEGKELIQIRAGGTEKRLIWSDPLSQYDKPTDDLDGLTAKDPRRAKTKAGYLGTALRILHGKDKEAEIAVWTSDGATAKLLDPENEGDTLDSLPKLGK